MLRFTMGKNGSRARSGLSSAVVMLLCVSCGGSTTDGVGSAGSGGAQANGGTGGAQSNGGTQAQGGTQASGGSAGSGGGQASGGSGATSAGLRACEVPSDCVLVPVSCCGICGAASRGDVTAINAERRAEHYAQACSAGEGCDDCYSPTDATLLATCEAGQCKVVDLETSAATECSSNQDCFLRTNECCECGGSQDVEHLVAVSRHGDIETFVCDPDTACLDCGPPPHEAAEAICAAGRCQVRWLLGGG